MRKAHGQKSTDRGYRLTTSSGTVCYDSDNTPFGYIMTYGIITCAQNYNFAGMERDSETGNDHTWFRGYEENLGRWMTPDLLGGDVGNPLVRHEKEFGERLDYMHLNPVKKGLVKRPEEWRWSSYNNFALDKATVAACPIQIDYVRLPLGYRA